MDEKLQEIFKNTNEWLRYAEAKSATLIAGNGALIFGIAKSIDSYDIDGGLAAYAWLMILLCLLSLVICLLSVVPHLSMPWESKPSGTSKDDNLLFFSDIAKYTPEAYLKRIDLSLNKNTTEFSDYQKMLASQIIHNSCISLKKHKYYGVAVWFTVAAVGSPLLILALFFLKRR